MALANVLLVSGSANFSTRDVWDGYRISLAAAGVRVIPYPTFSFLKVLSVDAVCNDILGTALDVANEIDTVVFVDGLYFRGERARVQLSLRRAGITTVLIATDDPYETIPNLESLYTHRFTNEIRCAVNGAVYLPTATLPLPIVPRTKTPRFDISFLGSVFEDRLPLILEVANFCEREGLRFLVAGKILGGTAAFDKLSCTEVRQRTIDTVEKLEIYSQSRLTINLFRQSETPADSPSPRVFEVTALGQAALLTGPHRSEVTRIFGDSVYHFDEHPRSIFDAIASAIADEQERTSKINRAQKITLDHHLYEHRADELISTIRQAERERSESGAVEDKVAWIIGCGRTGSTWLAEMLGDLPRIRRWHEPYFGRFFQHVNERPEERDRRASFFFKRHEQTWIDGLKELFFRMAKERYPQLGRQRLIVKEVNTPELYPWLRRVFGSSRIILLQRDPYDVLDSYLDLQKPGSWNQTFTTAPADQTLLRVRNTATHIRATILASLQTFADFPEAQRLSLSYEDLLIDPVPGLRACGRLLSIELDESDLYAVANKHHFGNYDPEHTGASHFRRQGKAGGWQSSQQFTPEVLEIAKQVLEPLRHRLGY